MTKQLVSAAINVARDSHYALNVVSGLYERTLLLEGASTNLCLQSENYGTTWAAIGTPTRTAAAIASSVMGVTLDLLGDDDAAAAEGYSQTITFTADGVKAISRFLKKGSSPGPGGTEVVLRDTTAGADRLVANVTWDGSGVPTVVMTTGTHLGTPIAYTNGVYRFRFATTSVTAANTNSLQVYPCRRGTVADTGNVYAGGEQAENLAFPSSYKKTTTVTVTRSTDALSFPYTPAPQETTFYAKLIECGLVLLAGTRLFTIGNAAATTSILLNSSGGKYQAFYDNGVTTVTRVAAAAPTFGDQVELRIVLSASGTLVLGQSLNGAAEVVTAASGANALPGAWSVATLTFGSPSPVSAYAALYCFKIARGTQTLATMQAA